MHLQRLLIISATAVVVSAILLGIYWLYYRYRLKNENRIAKINKLDHKLEEYLDSVPEQRRSKFKDLMLVKSISSAMIIVSLCFFLVGGISSASSPQGIRSTLSDPAAQVSIFGWFLWGLSLASLYISEGAAAMATRGIVAKPIPGFTRLRFISGKEAISFGIKRILSGIVFLSVILLTTISVLTL